MPFPFLDLQSQFTLDGEFQKLLKPIDDEPHGTCAARVLTILKSEQAEKLLYPKWEAYWRREQKIAWARFANDGGKPIKEAKALLSLFEEMMRYVWSADTPDEKKDCKKQLRKALSSYLWWRGVEVPSPKLGDNETQELEDSRWMRIADGQRITGINRGSIHWAANNGDITDNGKTGDERRLDRKSFTVWAEKRAKKAEQQESEEAINRKLQKARPIDSCNA